MAEIFSSELKERIMTMDSNGVPLPMIEGIVDDIIKYNIPAEITENHNNDMQVVERFVSESDANEEYVKDLILKGFSAQEIVETIKIDENVSIN